MGQEGAATSLFTEGQLGEAELGAGSNMADDSKALISASSTNPEPLLQVTQLKEFRQPT